MTHYCLQVCFIGQDFLSHTHQSKNVIDSYDWVLLTTSRIILWSVDSLIAKFVRCFLFCSNATKQTRNVSQCLSQYHQEHLLAIFGALHEKCSVKIYEKHFVYTCAVLCQHKLFWGWSMILSIGNFIQSNILALTWALRIFSILLLSLADEKHAYLC
jgi:hypothetical protein